jgi:hypothetical protein
VPLSGRPGGVYLDLPAKLFGQVMNAGWRQSLVKVIDPAPAQIPRRQRSSARSTCSRAPSGRCHPRQGRGTRRR